MVTKTSRVKEIESKVITYEGNIISGGSIGVEIFPADEEMKELFIEALNDIAESENVVLNSIDDSRVSLSFEITDVFTEKENGWIFILSDGESFELNFSLFSVWQLKRRLEKLWDKDCNELVPSIVRYCFNKRC